MAGLAGRRAERLDLEHRAGGRVIHRESLLGGAVEAYSRRTDRGELLLENLYFELPRQLAADELSVTLSLSDETAAVTTVPLTPLSTEEPVSAAGGRLLAGQLRA